MAERKAISKRMRFEVLKRDAFTCQYCGGQVPDVILHLDHIKPVSKGGKNTLLNLVTSCSDCNLGKSNKELSDDSAIKKQQNQTALLAEKKAQIEMMIEWRESLENSEYLLVESVASIVDGFMEDYSVSKDGRLAIYKAIKKNGYQNTCDSIKLFYSRCKSIDDFESNWSKKLSLKDDKGISIHYAKGILKNRFGYINEPKFYSFFNDYELNRDNIEIIVEGSKCCVSVSDFYYFCEVNL
tara:strand:+ start:44 stop:763 length:720 start_codon:yes stop_codon:yes gene_type:complete